MKLEGEDAAEEDSSSLVMPEPPVLLRRTCSVDVCGFSSEVSEVCGSEGGEEEGGLGTEAREEAEGESGPDVEDDCDCALWSGESESRCGEEVAELAEVAAGGIFRMDMPVSVEEADDDGDGAEGGERRFKTEDGERIERKEEVGEEALKEEEEEGRKDGGGSGECFASFASLAALMSAWKTWRDGHGVHREEDRERRRKERGRAAALLRRRYSALQVRRTDSPKRVA